METNSATSFPFQNVRLVFALSLIPSQTTCSILYLRVSKNDAVWVFSPACNASHSCCIQAVSISHILSLCWSTVVGPPFFRPVRVTLICDGKPQLTGITANVLTPRGNLQDSATVLKLSFWLTSAAGGIGRTTSLGETWTTGGQTL
jgi:hypothetical protein